MSNNTLYDQLKAAGCELDSHESDLYVRATPEAKAIIEQEGSCYGKFVNQKDGKVWFEVSFAYDPWWKARATK